MYTATVSNFITEMLVLQAAHISTITLMYIDPLVGGRRWLQMCGVNGVFTTFILFIF